MSFASLKSWKTWALAGILLGLIVIPPVGRSTGNTYYQTLVFFTFLFVTLSVAWNIIGGYTGQVSFGHAAFYGLGAYITAILWNQGLPPLLAVPVAGLIAGLYSLIIGYPTLRLRGPYFSIATIGVSEATRILMLNWEQVTGGASGLRMPTPPDIQSYAQQFYYIGLVVMIGAIWVSTWIQRSKFGLGLFAINMDHDAAESLGVNTARAKMLALAISAAIVGVAGSIYTQYVFYIDPQTVFGFSRGIDMILMATIGGVGTVWGPVLGAVVFGVVQDRLSTASLSFAGQTISLVQFNLLLYGSLLILIMLFEPKGLVGLGERIARRIRGEGRAPVVAPTLVPAADADGTAGR
ncbi:MAG: hypothetical protein A2Z04_02485 [Chloroflexi bacterium RBG_16_57_9]|nr:MAG: hypothetical protein A2Z04_02485 [Chloroflexi bacterium RBG_16_57_9]